jgi:hypothetical protein
MSGGYAAITAAVKSHGRDKAVDADAIKVETLNGNVMLSGLAPDRAIDRRKHRHEGPRREVGAEPGRRAAGSDDADGRAATGSRLTRIVERRTGR